LFKAIWVAIAVAKLQNQTAVCFDTETGLDALHAELVESLSLRKGKDFMFLSKPRRSTNFN
jgi:hypothetical protein